MQVLKQPEQTLAKPRPGATLNNDLKIRAVNRKPAVGAPRGGAEGERSARSLARSPVRSSAPAFRVEARPGKSTDSVSSERFDIERDLPWRISGAGIATDTGRRDRLALSRSVDGLVDSRDRDGLLRHSVGRGHPLPVVGPTRRGGVRDFVTAHQYSLSLAHGDEPPGNSRTGNHPYPEYGKRYRAVDRGRDSYEPTPRRVDPTGVTDGESAVGNLQSNSNFIFDARMRSKDGRNRDTPASPSPEPSNGGALPTLREKVGEGGRAPSDCRYDSQRHAFGLGLP